MMRQYKSRYQAGPGKCHICGRELDCSDSYSIVFDEPEKIVCIDCDKDRFIPQKKKEE